MAKLQCKILREGGTQVEVEDTTYDFQPNEAGDHVCEVGNIAHIGILKKIPEAYQAYEPAAKSAGDGSATKPAVPKTTQAHAKAPAAKGQAPKAPAPVAAEPAAAPAAEPVAAEVQGE